MHGYHLWRKRFNPLRTYSFKTAGEKAFSIGIGPIPTTFVTHSQTSGYECNQQSYSTLNPMLIKRQAKTAKSMQTSVGFGHAKGQLLANLIASLAHMLPTPSHHCAFWSWVYLCLLTFITDIALMWARGLSKSLMWS